MSINTITATFGGMRKTMTLPVNYQYDISQVLEFRGIELPSYFEVDFCNEGDVDTITMIGSSGAVQIPDQFLATGRKVKAYIVLTEDDSTQTRYEITIPVVERPARTETEPTPAEQSTIDQLIDALNDGVDAAEAAAASITGLTAEAETLPAGSSATASWDSETGTLTLGIPTGAAGSEGPEGPAGPAGSDGYSPTVTVEEIPGGHRVTITDAEGDHVFDVMDGQGGQGADDVFVATYGTTTNAEIETALTAGQIVFCKLTNAGVDYYLPMARRYSATDHRFAAQYAATDIYSVGVSCISDAWNSWNRRMMPRPSSASSGDALVYNGSAWAAKALDASDVGAYELPSGGIPKADMASAVQTSLGKADTALQQHQSLSAYRTAAAQDVIDAGKADKITEVTILTAGAVTQSMDAGKIYHFTGAVTSLSLTLNAASGQLAQYHFDFVSGSTATVVTIAGVSWPGGSFTPEANKRYEVDILNGYGVAMAWANS